MHSRFTPLPFTGFVRFVQPKSAKAVLKDFDQTEIVVQDVAVLVTSLGRPHVS